MTPTHLFSACPAAWAPTTARPGRPIRWSPPILMAAVQVSVRRALGLPVNDWDLWRLATSGDPRAAEALVSQLAPAALALARQMLGRLEDAEDVVQESFLRLWGAQADGSRGAQLSTYFHTIVLNRCRSLLVRQRELSTDPDDLTGLQDARQQALEAPLDTIDADALRQCLQRLPARQRMALALWAYTDADADAIGRALDIDTNAAHQLLFRAKRSLRERWQENRHGQ